MIKLKFIPHECTLVYFIPNKLEHVYRTPVIRTDIYNVFIHKIHFQEDLEISKGQKMGRGLSMAYVFISNRRSE